MDIFRRDKKAQALQTLTALIAPLVGIAIVISVGFLVLAEIKTQASSTTAGQVYAVNATETVMEAMDDIPDWLPIIVVAVIGAALLGLVALFRSR